MIREQQQLPSQLTGTRRNWSCGNDQRKRSALLSIVPLGLVQPDRETHGWL